MTEDGIEGWRWLGFGLLATDGVRDLEPVPGRTAGVDVRRAGPEDTQQVTDLIEALRQHMAASPTFLHQEDSVEIEENAEYLADPAHAIWLAYQGTEAVACMGQGPANPKASSSHQRRRDHEHRQRLYPQERARQGHRHCPLEPGSGMGDVRRATSGARWTGSR